MDVNKKEKISKKDEQINYYKISTFVLVGIIVLVILTYGFISYSSYRFGQGVELGQENTANYILETVAKNGYVTISSGNSTYLLIEQNVVISSLISSVLNEGKVDLITQQGNITLVPSILLDRTKEDTILEILGIVREKGYVSLYDNESQITLIPYVEPGKVQE